MLPCHKKRLLTRAVSDRSPDLERVLILGAYGTGNLGDELILGALLRILARAYPRATFRVLSYTPTETEGFQRIQASSIPSFRPWRTALRLAVRLDLPGAIHQVRGFRESERLLDWAQVLVLGGGNLLVDGPCYFLEHFVGEIVRRAVSKGIHIALFGVGMGPIVTNEGRRLMTQLAQDWASTICVREVRAAETLRSVAPYRSIHLAADPVLVSPPPSDETVPHEEDAVGVSLRPVEWLPSVASHLTTAVTWLRARSAVKGIAVHKGVDLEALRAYLKPSELWEPNTPNDLYRTISSCNIVLGQRLHALILASAATIPFVALSYHQKIDDFVSQLGTGLLMGVAELSRSPRDRLVGLLAAALAGREQGQRELGRRVAVLRERSLSAMCASLRELPFRVHEDFDRAPAHDGSPYR